MNTRGRAVPSLRFRDHEIGERVMKKIAIATSAVLALLSIAGCANMGKGKAPPPVVTKG